MTLPYIVCAILCSKKKTIEISDSNSYLFEKKDNLHCTMHYNSLGRVRTMF